MAKGKGKEIALSDKELKKIEEEKFKRLRQLKVIVN